MTKTKNLIPTILSILAFASVCVLPTFVGIVIASILGSIFGFAAIICNKEKRKLVYILSAIPMVILVVFLLMYIPYSFYK